MVNSNTFRPASLGDILNENRHGTGHVKESVYWPHLSVKGQVFGMTDLPQSVVTIDPLGEIAQGEFKNQKTRELESHIAWDQREYRAFPAGIYKLRDVILHSQVGIICFSGCVVSETLWHTIPEVHNYLWVDDCITIPDRIPYRLQGRTLSLLGIAKNYFHSVIDGVARLALLPEASLDGINHLLLPEGGVGQSELIRLHGLPATVSVRYVTSRDTFLVDELVFPWTLHGVFDFHPQMNAFFDRILARTPAVSGSPTHVYVDRRGSSLRKLVNEDAVVSAVEQLGFVIVRLENLSQLEQITLFQNAQLVVSPHGAGLTNLCFSTPGTVIIELMMDAYLNWCYRRIATVRKLRYDCVLGQAIGEWRLPGGDFHAQQWEIPVDKVIATIKSVTAR
ncbi:glycosyltransferase family 61 protein [Methylobacterium flocculans]|uniref:glycosyltransferase family 61 protein n=1 Tax=Methylobacterium flocculans TaxID=2984843 RepID=UPI0021F2A04D|nr:glycosyltransferase family 61 protein [Methylobacterium sp. FF17]